MQWTYRDIVIEVRRSGRFLTIDGHASRDYDTLGQAKKAIDESYEAMPSGQYGIDYGRVPEHIRDGVRDYIERGHLPGHFLQSVISNDLSQSFGYADEVNRARLFEIVNFFHNEAPGQCWGSPEKMAAWKRGCGLVGKAGR